MTSRRQRSIDRIHSTLPMSLVCLQRDTTLTGRREQFHLCGKNLFRTAEKLSRRVGARRVRSRSSQSRVALGAVACVLYRQFRFRNEQNSTDHPVLLPTKWSSMCSLRSPSFYGRMTPPRTSRPQSPSSAAARNAPSARSSATSKHHANGRLTGRPSSLPKFLDVKACGTFA